MSQFPPSQTSELPMTDGPARRIAVLVEFDDTWGRNVVEAIARYSHDAGWQLLLAPRDAERRLRIPEGWEGDGAIVMIRDESLIDHIRNRQIPAVDLGSMFPEIDWLGRVMTNDCARAKMALDHFRTRQLQHFACYAPVMGRYPQQRSAEFRNMVNEAGFECHAFNTEQPGTSIVDRESLAQWLRDLPRPVGIFASDPYPARQLAEICAHSGFDVPGEIAILSGDEDELLCGIMSPQISSIELASHRIGFEAARMLDHIIRTGEVPQQPIMIDPLRVCSRRSTDYLAIGDPDLKNVVRLIWEHAADGVQVSDLVRAAAMSRRKMEQRFREVLGRTPAEEIRRVKLEQARQMMVTTSMSVAAIALSCGFSSGPYLAHAFRKQYGITPSELRVGRETLQQPAMPRLTAVSARLN